MKIIEAVQLSIKLNRLSQVFLYIKLLSTFMLIGNKELLIQHFLCFALGL